mmetsp:Transcript_33348/g.76064  ORF Transcript_33348/g.76064 Transcript_33348/m.76064 type:complete len:310 (+) Transcript_33348:1585-2514(+)
MLAQSEMWVHPARPRFLWARLHWQGRVPPCRVLNEHHAATRHPWLLVAFPRMSLPHPTPFLALHALRFLQEPLSSHPHNRVQSCCRPRHLPQPHVLHLSRSALPPQPHWVALLQDPRTVLRLQGRRSLLETLLSLGRLQAVRGLQDLRLRGLARANHVDYLMLQHHDPAPGSPGFFGHSQLARLLQDSRGLLALRPSTFQSDCPQCALLQGPSPSCCSVLSLGIEGSSPEHRLQQDHQPHLYGWKAPMFVRLLAHFCHWLSMGTAPESGKGHLQMSFASSRSKDLQRQPHLEDVPSKVSPGAFPCSSSF